MSKKLKAVLFDLDGVLVNTTPLLRETYVHVATLARCPTPDDEQLKRAFALSPSKGIRAICGRSDDKLLRAFEAYGKQNRERLLTAFSGIPDTLRLLATYSIQMAAVTSRNREDAFAYLSAAGLTTFMDTVVVFGDYRRAKPAPDCILMALDRLRTEPEDAAYVGDSPSDILAARRSGVIAIAALWGTNFAEADLRSASPDWIVAHPHEIIGRLDSPLKP